MSNVLFGSKFKNPETLAEVRTVFPAAKWTLWDGLRQNMPKAIALIEDGFFTTAFDALVLTMGPLGNNYLREILPDDHPLVSPESKIYTEDVILFRANRSTILRWFEAALSGLSYEIPGTDIERRPLFDMWLYSNALKSFNDPKAKELVEMKAFHGVWMDTELRSKYIAACSVDWLKHLVA